MFGGIWMSWFQEDELDDESDDESDEESEESE
jgi:hypothetical protein